MKYSKSQLEAINHIDGPALVLAVPGAGKTTVLLARIHNLIKKGVNPENILAMTFSKAQAIDMENRYFKIYGSSSIKFSTIHSFAYGIIRMFYRKNIEIIENSTRFNKNQTVAKMYFSLKRRKMTDEQMETFFRVSSFLKNTLLSYEDYKKMYSNAFAGFEQLYFQYEDFKKQNNLIDFDDMLILALEILKTNKSALAFLQEKFSYIQVDEGQDTSFVQMKIIELISNKSKNIFIVADDDQSIYGFRGADSKILLEFPKKYPDTKIYFMSENYRSAHDITSLSNKLITNNKIRYEKSIVATKEHESQIYVKEIKSTKLQSQIVLENAKKDLENGESVAILYRNNLSAVNLLNYLPDNLSFSINDGKYAFYSNPIIQDIKNILNFCVDFYDLESFEKIYYKFNLFIKKDFVDQLKYMDTRLDVLDRLKEVEGLNGFFLEKIYLLSYNFEKLKNLDFYRQVKFILFDMDYYEYLKEFCRRSADSMLTFDRILDTILNIAEKCKSLLEFEERIRKLIEKQKSHSKVESNLYLSTIHGAKGLEFDSVYLIDLVENEFPSSYSESKFEKTAMLEEERRLFYVAMTRAKSKLSMYYPKYLYDTKVEQSLFLEEIMTNKELK